MKLGELFAGYGGLGMAVEEVFGAELAWVSELEEAPSKILAHHWPNVPNHGDITKISWASIEPVDIISGGSPCQDLSLAGKRRGMTEGTRSNLWESMREGIATIKPQYVVWENVRGALSAEAVSDSDMEQREGFLGERRGHLRALGRVLGDLADLGFDAEWRGLRASDVGAPHGRFRIFVLASTPNNVGSDRSGFGAKQDRWGQSKNGRNTPTNTESNRWHEGGTEPTRIIRGSDASVSSARDAATSHAISQGLQRPHHPAGTSQAERHGYARQSVDWGRYAGAIRRWEALRGTAPTPIERNPRGGVRLRANLPEWMMGLPNGWVTDPAIGISRNEKLKACGNGVVPQQAAAALRDMLAAFEERDLAA